MEEKKKKHHKGNQPEAGQRISVRPGNFTPPSGASAAPAGGGAPAGATPAGSTSAGGSSERREGGNRHKHGRHGRHHSRPKQGNQQGNPQNAQKPDNGVRNQENKDAAPRHERGRHGRHRREEGRAAQPQGSPVISASLQNELNEEFSTATLGAYAPSRKDQKREQEAVESDEFSVDIATAAYLLDDIPCGFPVPDGKAVTVVGVRFRRAGKVYFFAPGNENYRVGDPVLVDTARGEELGEIVMPRRRIAERQVVQPLRAVLRRAGDEDIKHDAENRQKESEALRICEKKIGEHKLDMRLVDAQYTFDNSKLLFYFTSEGRVDFRDLVRDLAGIFHTRIELRQIGIRDEARLIGGLGMCGRPFCCSTYLSDFGQVSIKMAKEQGLSINTSKISGCCGRLMCCLRYEHEAYAEEAKLTPKKGTLVETPDGRGVVEDCTPLAGTVRVKLNELPEEPARVYHRDTVTVLAKKAPQGGEGQGNKPDNGAKNTQNVPLSEPDGGES